MNDLPLYRHLTAVEDGDAWYVVVEGNRDDWLVRFEESATFPAYLWASNMVRVFNGRLSSSRSRAEADSE